MQHQKNWQKTFLAYLLILAALFMIALVWVPQYQSMIAAQDEKQTQEALLKTASDRLQKLQDIRQVMQNQAGEDQVIIQQLSQEFVEAEVFEYIHEYTRSLPSRRDIIVLRDMSFWGTQTTDLWFQSTDITLSFVVSSEQTLFRFIDFLNSSEGKYAFFIPSFSYPLGEVQGNFSVDLPLTLYHR